MRKFLLLFVALATVTMVWAGKYEHSFTGSSTSPYTSSVAGSTQQTATLSDLSWTVTTTEEACFFAQTTSNGLQIGSKNNQSGNFTLSTSGLSDSIITQIKVDCYRATNSTATLSVNIGTDALGTQNQTLGTSSSSLTFSDENGFSGAVTLSFNNPVVSGKSAAVYIQKITITYKAPEPTTKTVYCKMTYDWWTTASAAIAVHYWGGATSTTWPGIRMTEVEDNIWGYDIPADATNFCFVRVNGSGDVEDWGAKTVDLAFQTDGKNLYTITSSTEHWGDNKCEGTWSAYTPPVPTYYITGNAALVGAAKAWKADAIEMTDGAYTFSNLPAGEYSLKVTLGDWNKTAWGFDALKSGSSDKLYYASGDKNIQFDLAATGDVKVEFDGSKITMTGAFVQHYTPFEVEVPAGTENCYIAGGFNGWALTKMTWDATNELFKYDFPGVADTAHYKYCAGPAWKYEELDKDGNQIANRTYDVSDEVEKWAKLPGATLADIYTSNVTLTTDGGTSATASKAIVFGTEYDAIKAGTTSIAGKVVVTVPAGVKRLHFHALGWSGKSVKLQVAAGDDVLANLDLNADAGVTGGGPKYTIVGDPEAIGYYSVLVNTAVETQISFTATADCRFLLFGVNTELIPIDPRAKREIVLEAGTNALAAADPSMFVMAWADGKEPYDTVMTVKKVGDDTLYVARIPEELDSVVFVRAATGLKDKSQLIWEDPGKNVWNQTANLEIGCDTAVFSEWTAGGKFTVAWCPVPVISKWYIVGGFTKWLTNKVELEATEKADSLSVKIELKADTAVNFKLIRIRTQGAVALDTTWYGLPKDGEGNVDEVHYGHSTGLLFYDDGVDVKLNPTNANDDYTFSVDVAHMVGTNLVPVVDVIIPKRVRPVDTREKRDIVLEAGEVATADPSMFVFAWGNGKTAYDTVMTIKKVGDDTLYVARIPEELDSLIFVRAAHGLEDWSEIIWSGVGANVWNQTEDLLVEADTAAFEKWIEGTNKFAITWKKIKPIDTRVKREIVLDAGGQLQVDDPSMFVMAFGDGKAAYDTVMTIKTVGDDTLYLARIPEELDSLVFVRAAHGLEDWSELVWDTSDPNYNVWNQTANLEIGCDTAVFSEWAAGGKFTVAWCPVPELPIDTTWYIAGGFNEWTIGASQLTGTDPKALSVKVTLDNDSIVPFKVVRVRTQGAAKLDTVWYGLTDGIMSRTNCTGWWMFDNQGNVQLVPSKVGEYTFTVDVTNEGEDNEHNKYLAPALTITMPAPELVTIKLVPGELWKQADAKFAVFTWSKDVPGLAEWSEFVSISATNPDTLSFQIDAKMDSIEFERFHPEKSVPAFGDDSLWNNVKDLINLTSKVFTITDWTEGTWAAYDPGEVVHYYITGNEALVGVGKDWDTEAIPVKGSDSYTFKNLAAATEYQLKLTTGGDWTTTTAYGFADLAYQVAGVTDNGEGNITFTLAEAGDVKITLNSEKKIVIEGNFVKPVTQYGLLINDADFKAAWQNPNNPVELMLTGVSLSNGDKFVLYDDDNDASWIISNFKDDSYTFNIAGEAPNKYYEVTEAGLYDFYVYSTYDGTDNYIYVAKQGSTGCENVYGTEVELRKVIENGVLYIYRDGKVYNIQGQLVR